MAILYAVAGVAMYSMEEIDLFQVLVLLGLARIIQLLKNAQGYKR